MLSRSSNRTLRVLSRPQVRSFFDYLAEVNKPTSKVSTSQTTTTTTFSWEFLDYFKKHEPEKAAEYEGDQKKASNAEQYLSKPTPAHPKLDFAKNKSRIADPGFVDRMETEYKAVNDYWSKWTKYSQTTEWSATGWVEESQREYSFEPVPKNEEELRAAKIMKSHEVMEKHRELLEEVKLDYEQLEAERDLFATSEETVQFALHPQLAEVQEETAAGKQTFHDFLMSKGLYARYVKYERLAQAQNEERRKLFLDRYKHFSYLNGHEQA